MNVQVLLFAVSFCINSIYKLARSIPGGYLGRIVSERASDMYRLILSVVICVHATAAAPQTLDSDVTYVKIQPAADGSPASLAAGIRESRIEKLPLTFPGNFTTDNKEPDKIDTENASQLSGQPDEQAESSDQHDDYLSVAPVKTTESTESLSEKVPVSEDNESESEKSNPKSNADLSVLKPDDVSIFRTTDLSELSPTDLSVATDLSESDSENVSDTVPSETSQSDRRARNFESVETTETTEATETYEEHTEIEVPRLRAPPRFVPKAPKLSYFQKPKVFQSYSSNLVENAAKRRFRSRCRCEKIWNCPKLQISVPRCPEEYFLCCF